MSLDSPWQLIMVGKNMAELRHRDGSLVTPFLASGFGRLDLHRLAPTPFVGRQRPFNNGAARDLRADARPIFCWPLDVNRASIQNARKESD